MLTQPIYKWVFYLFNLSDLCLTRLDKDVIFTDFTQDNTASDTQINTNNQVVMYITSCLK